MNPRSKSLIVFLILCMGIFFLNSQAYAAKPIAKVSSFSGEAFMKSDINVFRVTRIGQVLYDGDFIQTKEGEVQITFNDGALMKIRPFTNTMIQEREEKSGFWLFKTKKLVRRMTIFVGKLWFKSGISKRKNFIQTPTAVCGIRGSELEAGYNNVDSLLNLIKGLVDKVGPWTEGPFADPGAVEAFKNSVYAAVADAQDKIEKTKAIEDPEAREKALAEAQKAALDVVIDAAELLKTNPDPAVAGEAEKAGDAAEELKKEIEDTGKPLPTTTTIPGTTVAPTTVAPTTVPTSTSTTFPTTTTEASPAS